MNDTVHIYDMIIYDILHLYIMALKGRGWFEPWQAVQHRCIQGFHVWIPMQRLDLRKPSIPSSESADSPEMMQDILRRLPRVLKIQHPLFNASSGMAQTLIDFDGLCMIFFWVVGGAIDAVDDMDGENVAKTRVVNRGIDFLKAACEFADEVSCFTLFHCLLRALQDLFPRSKPNLAGILCSWGMHH